MHPVIERVPLGNTEVQAISPASTPSTSSRAGGMFVRLSYCMSKRLA